MYAKNTKRYVQWQLIYSLCTSLIPLVTLYALLPNTMISRVYVFAIVSVILSMLSINTLLRIVNHSLPSFGFFKRSVMYGIPVCGLAVMGWAKLGFDMYMTSVHYSYEISGGLFFAFQLVSVLTILGASLNKHSKIELFGYINKNRVDLWWEKLWHLSKLTFIFYLLLSMSVSVLIHYQMPEYAGAIFGVWIIGFGAVFYIIAQYISSLFLYLEKTYVVTFFIALSALLHSISTYSIIVFWESERVEISYLISYFIFFIGIFASAIYYLRIKKLA